MNWTLRLAKIGTEKLFEPYKKAIIEILLDAKKPLGSGAVWEAVNKKVKISRASVICFLNFMVDDGLCTFGDATGKGGHHRLYKLAQDWEGVKRHLKIRIIEGLGEALEDDVTELLELL